MMTIAKTFAPTAPSQRARGSLHIRAERRAGRTRIADLRQSGSLRGVFPHGKDPMQAVLVNTSGGITGGDRFEISAEAGPGAALILSTQTAERGYRALAGQTGRLSTRLSAEEGATLAWVPQETILFDGAALTRRLEVSLSGDARFMMVEPLVFGRRAMGETVDTLRFSDSVRITRDGTPLWREGIGIDGNAEALLDRPAVADGGRSLATLLYAAPDAEALAGVLRLPETAALSLLPGDLIAIRIVARDGFDLRRALLPVLAHLIGDALPTCWSL